MDEIESKIRSGQVVNIYCSTGIARKIYHQWARVKGFSSTTTFSEDLGYTYLFQCPSCKTRGYRGKSDNDEELGFLFEGPFYTSYDSFDGRCYDYSIACLNCGDYDDYFVTVNEDDTIGDVNGQSCDGKIMFKIPDSVMICDYDQAPEIVKRKINKHRKKRGRPSDVYDDLEAKITAMVPTIRYEISTLGIDN
jgi:hypothetical protein